MLQAFVAVRSWLDQRLSIQRWYRLWMLPKAWVLTILQVFVIGSLVTINLVIHTWGVLRRSRMWLTPLILLYFLCFNPVHAHYFRNYSDQGKTYLFLHFKLEELAFTLKNVLMECDHVSTWITIGNTGSSPKTKGLNEVNSYYSVHSPFFNPLRMINSWAFNDFLHSLLLHYFRFLVKLGQIFIAERDCYSA